MELDYFTYTVSLNKAKVLEGHILVLLKPHPWYIPYKLWVKLATKFICIQERNVS